MVQSLAFRPDSRLLASARDNGTIWPGGVDRIGLEPAASRGSSVPAVTVAKAVCHWEVAGGGERVRLAGTSEGLHCVALYKMNLLKSSFWSTSLSRPRT
jgi:hypothetical protein